MLTAYNSLNPLRFDAKMKLEYIRPALRFGWDFDRDFTRRNADKGVSYYWNDITKQRSSEIPLYDPAHGLAGRSPPTPPCH